MAFSTKALFLLGCIGLGMLSAVNAADADPLQDFTFPGKNADQVEARDFINSDGIDNFNNQNPDKFTATIINRDTFKITGDQGLSWAVLNFAPGTQNTPHEHPRATEILFVVRGELFVGIADTRPMAMGGPRFFNTTITAGQLVVFPRGLAHFQINKSDKPTLALASLNSANPGTVRLEDVLKAFRPTLNGDDEPKAYDYPERRRLRGRVN